MLDQGAFKKAKIEAAATGETLMDLQDPLLSYVILFSRICMGMVFLVSGTHKAIWFDKAIVEYTEAGVRFVKLSVCSTIVLHIWGSLALFSGLLMDEFCVALSVFLVLANFQRWDWWNKEGMEKLIASRNALANLAMIGGLILLAITGSGSFTI
jgi:putative oxidoreductase